MILKTIYQFTRKHFELLFWVIALIALFFIQPSYSNSLCVYKALGFPYCPGCGIGHSIHFLLHGQLQQSIKSHPFGILAVPIIISRIITLANINFHPKLT